MTETHRFALLPHRGVLAVGGADRKTFLQGLLSNDVSRVAPDRAIWAALLTPQGKVLHDLFITERDDVVFLEGEAERLEDLQTRLRKYKLRAKVTLEPAPDLTVAAVFDTPPRTTAGDSLGLRAEAGAATPFGPQGTACVDPRLAEAGLRILLPAGEAADLLASMGTAATAADYDAHRLYLGLPDGSRDLPVEKAFPMEAGFDDLSGVDFRKGCYIGQETTTRMKYRGLVRKRLMPVRVDGPLPAPGTPVTLADGTSVGEVRSGDAASGQALALVKLAALSAAPFAAGDASLTPLYPDWMHLPETA